MRAKTDYFVIGAGEVGRRITAALRAAQQNVAVVTRTAGWADATATHDAAPRIVAVREEQLAEVLGRFGESDRERLALVQNGFLEAVHGDIPQVTRGLLWFTAKGDFFRELRSSLWFGRLAHPLVAALRTGGLSVEELLDETTFRREMIIKGLWNCVVGLPLAVHGLDLSTYLTTHEREWRAVLAEGAAAASLEYGVRVAADEAAATLLATTAALGWVRGGMKALAWRNGALARFGRRRGVPTPVNDALLRAAGSDPDAGDGNR